mmetsp:Transcript_22369/g.48144  ORF Transcript_22369/g.48144 Transcript_22369/m.48144 type:complete len:335 (+) Transcript_22369:126-1130(+)|eukprot:CAMPEP_0172565386 /NCGR_PEP_ID=MMETSP1067-20121228/107895_1 /TAXON_ID=265564 ORGANISM="Thalassiosira punctigera, Strain Tpunct2005C2" /NCGR_SAMPLE_ID=MMETSP1067 /ASSEMBLY_ACC=CAM_ASM_000444 /LENGTH=334 /DNA_ID=CAMNT_0013356243 /DNA_START=37 /DNA_END=1041 /DNA_ORIENTATION=+
MWYRMTQNYRFRLVLLWLLSYIFLFSHIRSIQSFGPPDSGIAPKPAPAPCVAILLANSPKDVRNSILAIKSIDDYIKDGGTTPILIFHEGNLSNETKQRLSGSSQKREIIFPYIDFSSYPPGFDPLGEIDDLNSTERGSWGYQQVRRFWISRLWTHDAVRERNCGIIMRMDADSCFMKDVGVGDALPGLKLDEVYRANTIQTDNPAQYVRGLMQLTRMYMEKKNLKPRNEELWEQANRLSLKMGRLPSFDTNFEVSKVSFFAREDVMDYQMAVADQQPFGVFRQRWGDAHVRFLTLALFAEPSMIDLSVPSSYSHGWRCPGIHGNQPLDLDEVF